MMLSNKGGINEEMLDDLRMSVSFRLSEKRYRHTYEVEKMSEFLASLYDWDNMNKIRAAALLHDITKEYKTDAHLKICRERGIELHPEAHLAPKTLHAVTAAALIPELYPEFADEDIITAVRYHTTGRRDMTLIEKLVYLADYIDMTRDFEDCVKLRRFFLDKKPERMTREERLHHLDDTLILSFNMTIKGILDEGGLVSLDTMDARNSLLAAKRKR